MFVASSPLGLASKRSMSSCCRCDLSAESRLGSSCGDVAETAQDAYDQCPAVAGPIASRKFMAWPLGSTWSMWFTAHVSPQYTAQYYPVSSECMLGRPWTVLEDQWIIWTVYPIYRNAVHIVGRPFHVCSPFSLGAANGIRLFVVLSPCHFVLYMFFNVMIQ